MANEILIRTNKEGLIKRPPGVKILIDQIKCIKCGICVEVCPFGLPQKNQDQSYTIPHPELCTECGACKNNCPTGAILLEEQKGCGCLWNVKAKKKQNSDNCCESNSNDSCCC